MVRAAVTPGRTDEQRLEIDRQARVELLEELREALARDYVVMRELGSGGMGVVYLAQEPALNRTVVIKALAPELYGDPEARDRFRREALSAAAVPHPNVIDVYRAGTLPRSGMTYFVMQHVLGGTLADEFPPGTTAPPGRLRRIAIEVASALAAAHARGLIHYDVKPTNIMVEKGSGRCVVLDFGFSAALSSGKPPAKLTKEGSSIGAATYMSPELAKGDATTHATDVYSLAAVLFELATGRPPFEATKKEEVREAHQQQDPPPVRSLRSDLPADLAELIDSSLSKKPHKRPTAADVVHALAPDWML